MMMDVVAGLAASIEACTVRDPRVADRLRWDPRGEATDPATQFRRFVLSFPRTLSREWLHEKSPTNPSYQTLTVPCTILYPVTLAENTEAVAGMALDDAFSLPYHLALDGVTRLTARGITGFQAMGVRAGEATLEVDDDLPGFVLNLEISLRFVAEP